MTETEWFASKDPVAMGAAVLRRKRASERVLRLCCAAFWGWQSGRLKTKTDEEQLRKAVAALELWADTRTRPPASRKMEYIFLDMPPRVAFSRTVGLPSGWSGKYGRDADRRLVWALREIFGNPFATKKRKRDPYRGWTFDPAWRTDTVVALANRVYDAREFSAMPILADALQDAGCTNEDVLSHCREPGEHVRGCWVLDLVSGRG